MHTVIGLFDKETVRVSAVFRPEDREDEGEEDSHDGETDKRLDAFLAPGIGVVWRRTRCGMLLLAFVFGRAGFNEDDHSDDDGAVDQGYEVGFNYELSLTAAVYVSHLTGLRVAMKHRRSADVIPHLAGCHGQNDTNCPDAPRFFVVQEFQIVAPDVEQNGDEAEEKDDEDCCRVIWGAHDLDGYFRSFLDPTSHHLRGKPKSLQI